MKHLSSSKLFFSIGLLSLAASFLIVGVGHAEFRLFNLFGGSTSSNSSASGGASAPVVNERVIRQEDEIVATVRRVEPAVVSVIITKDLPKLEITNQDVPFENDFPGFPNDPFFQQFRIQIPQYRQNGTEKKEVGGGTAFFVSADGLLMTNKHVVDDEKAEYTVLLNDGKKVPAKVVGRDPVNDIALLKIDGSNYPFLQLSSTDDLNLGQTAIAIGNSLGEFRNTVSVGVISGLRRSITAGRMLGGNPEHLDQIIQTDAAINEGNSGGPLLDSQGEVVGMNTAIASGGQNIGFALPAKELRRVLQSYQKNGRIVRVFLGVRYVPITSEVKQKNHLSYDYGVLVGRGETHADLAVIPGSPADKAGIQENDIILEADGQKLTQEVSLQQIVSSKSVGDTIKLKVFHKGSTKDLTVTLEEMKS